MSNLINPLQALVDQASKAKESGKIDLYAQRINANPAGVSAIALDTSGSMNERVESGARKIDVLRQSLDRPLSVDEVAITFNCICTQLPSLQAIPEPGGGTAMHLALAEIANLKPRQTLVISDGRPDLKQKVLAEAKGVTGVINTLYIGSDDDLEAIEFMRQLARVGCGISRTCDIRVAPPKQLKSAIALLLSSSK